MKKLSKIFIIFSFMLLLYSCSNEDSSKSVFESFCAGATADSYSEEFQVWCPTLADDGYLPVKYGCSPQGKGISPPLQWKGLPEGTTHLHVLVEDATCTYMCNDCCKFHHWQLEFSLEEVKHHRSITPVGIAEGASNDPFVKKFTLENTLGKNEYMPLCPPIIQTHAFVFQLIAYRLEEGKKMVLGRSQSMPMLYSRTR